MLAAAGGKGLNLSLLFRAGFPVPPGFIVSTAAYDTFVQDNGLAEAIQETLETARLDEMSSLEMASRAIRARFTGGQMPPELGAAIRTAYAALGHLPVAVRSSATAEDLPGLSFAGQQDTMLNVIGKGALLRAVIDCWSSLWTARAIGYRARNGIDQRSVSLAVVVQAMVSSETSGVLFTANPLTGKRDETVIDATFGLGEALVSGQVEPDRYVVKAGRHMAGETPGSEALGGGTLVSKTLGSKATVVRGRQEGGTVTLHQDAAGRQALEDEQILELAGLGRRAADLFGAPQDVEWAAADGRLYILQSRPITTLYPLPDGMPAGPLRAMFSFGSVQGMLDPMTPLGRDAIVTTLIGAGKVFGSRVTLETQSLLWEAGERLWVDLSGLVRNRAGRRLARAALPTVDPGAALALKGLIDRGRFPPPGPLRARTALRILRALIPMLLRALRTVLRPDAERERLFRLLETMVADFEARFARAADLPARLALIRHMADRAFEYVIPQFVSRFGVGMAAFNLLSHLAAGLPAGTCDVRVMMRGVPHNVTTEMDLALWRAAQAIGADPASLAHFRASDAAALAGEYLLGSLPPPAQAAIDPFMARYGMRGLAEIDLGRPRWREDPLPVFQTLRAYLDLVDASPDNGPLLDRGSGIPMPLPGVAYEQGKRAAEAEIGRLLTALRGQRGGWIAAGVARRAAYRMRALVGLREAPKYALVRLFSIMRRALLADGARLAAEGRLVDSDDLFYLHMRELDALAAGEQRDWAALARARRQTVEREKRRRQIPRLLLSDGQAFYGGAAASEPGDGATLYGDPVSPGVVEGGVRVVLDPRAAQLAPGEILVCPGTDPSWTPLFLVAGGLVMEVGGLMTHGAVVAREYGLPAVVGVHEATQRLRTGQRVRVDGSSGQVTLLDD